MNATDLDERKIDFRRRLANQRTRRRFRHDPWLVVNMASFNFGGGRNRSSNPFRTRASRRF